MFLLHITEDYMKNIKNVILGAFLFVFMSCAFAAYTPKDVVNAVNNGEWQKAEVMIKEVTASRPESAQAWFYRAQIELELAKQGQATAEQASESLRRAMTAPKKMDGGDAKYQALSNKIAALGATDIPSDIKQAIMDKRWSTAERKLNDFTSNNPESAKAWYYLAQVQEHTGNYNNALVSINKAVANDKALSFTDNPSNVSKLKNRIESQIQNNTVVAKVEKANNTPVPQSVSDKPVHKSEKVETYNTGMSDSAVWGMVKLFAVLGFILFLVYVFIFRNNKKSEDESQEKMRTVHLNYINTTYKELETISDDLAFIDKESSYLYKEVQEVRTSLGGMVIHFTQGKNQWQSHMPELNRLKERVEYIKENFANKKYEKNAFNEAKSKVSSTVNSATSSVRNTVNRTVNKTSEMRNRTNTDSSREVHHHHNNNSNNDLLTGVLIGSVLNNSNSHTTVVKEREVERSSYTPPKKEEDNSFDFGSSTKSSGSSFDFGSSNRDSGFDFGSSSNSGSSGFDSGGSNNNDW
jgi:tetratricopeptide (TPR) repeat protein